MAKRPKQGAFYGESGFVDQSRCVLPSRWRRRLFIPLRCMWPCSIRPGKSAWNPRAFQHTLSLQQPINTLGEDTPRTATFEERRPIVEQECPSMCDWITDAAADEKPSVTPVMEKPNSTLIQRLDFCPKLTLVEKRVCVAPSKM